MRFGQFANAPNRQVIGLCAAGCEDNFVRPRADERRYLPPGSIGSGPRFLTEVMDARGVAKLFSQIRQHRLDDASVNRRRGTMIEIDFPHRRFVCLEAAYCPPSRSKNRPRAARGA